MLRQGGAKDESPRLDTDQRVGLVGRDGLGEARGGFAKTTGIREQRRDVLEQDAGLRKVGYVANQ